jgi:hypothetical protein
MLRPRSQRPGALWRSVTVLALLALLVGCGAPAATPVAAFDVGGIAFSGDRADILPGDEVEVTARVENGGTAAGSYRAELSVDGAVEARQDVTLDPGESTTVRFVVQAGTPGNHEITIGPAMATLHVVADAAFRVSGLRLATEAVEIQAGDPLEYVADVTNTGAKAGTYDAALVVDGAVQASQSVPVDPGEKATVRFSIVAGSPGVHDVEVGEAQASYTVLAPAAVAVTGLELSDEGVPTGREVEAVVTVGNRGGAIGTLAVQVAVDGKVVASKDVTVAGGDELAVRMPFVVTRAGRHTVTAGAFEQRIVGWKITRPANGAILVNKARGGQGHLKVKNGDDDLDTVVVLASTSNPKKALLAVYVRSNKSVTVKGIKDGRYVAYFTFGERWDGHARAFTSSQDRRRFADTLRFKTTRTSTSIRYSIITLSLHQSGGGTAPTDFVSDEDFPAVP